MAMSTSLVGPYDVIPTHAKTRIMCGVPTTVLHQIFDRTFNQRGVQDKILARLFHVFWLELTSQMVQQKLSECVTSRDREDVLNSILNKIAFLQSTHENQDVKPTTTSES